MRSSAYYNKLDYQTYFEKISKIKNNEVIDFLKKPEFIFSVEAFYLGFSNIRESVSFISRECGDIFNISPEMNSGPVAVQLVGRCVETLKQAARLRFLNFNGKLDEQLMSVAVERYPYIYDKKLHREFWGKYKDDLICGVYVGSWSLTYSELMKDDLDKYISYFMISFPDVLKNLLSDGVFIATVSAFFYSGRESADSYLNLIERAFELSGAHNIPLENTVKVRLLVRIINDIRDGVISIPGNLNKKYPDIYKDVSLYES